MSNYINIDFRRFRTTRGQKHLDNTNKRETSPSECFTFTTYMNLSCQQKLGRVFFFYVLSRLKKQKHYRA